MIQGKYIIKQSFFYSISKPDFKRIMSSGISFLFSLRKGVTMHSLFFSVRSPGFLEAGAACLVRVQGGVTNVSHVPDGT